MKIALDAFGGDHAPAEIVAGGIQAHRTLGVDVIFLGPKARVDEALTAAGAGKWEQIEDAPEIIAMDEHPAQAVRSKRASSIVRGVQMVADGRADAFVSAGNSGAIMAGALFGLRRIRGVDRPAIGSRIPTLSGRDCFLLDVGANAEARPDHLLQFALMGAIYAKRLMGIADPRVALLSIGEEVGKGNQLVQDADALLRGRAGLHYVGNIEGKDVFRGGADVIVADGFTGNVLIKTAEGAAEFLFRSLRDAVRGDPLAMIGGALVRPKIQSLRRRADWREFGGALLLGVNGVTVIAHGRSDARAILNAVRVARDAVRNDVVATVQSAMGARSTAAESATAAPAGDVT